jgi:hypothetical protein
VFHIAKDDNNDLRVKTEKREEKRRREENRGEERRGEEKRGEERRGEKGKGGSQFKTGLEKNLKPYFKTSQKVCG